LYINGEWKDSQNGRTFPTINPVTEEEVIKVAEASQDMEGSWVGNH
jgi:acyl-CoA reductase-like NAD-dependent aldehyde dehydrogenase